MTALILAQHGSPPLDYPKDRLRHFFHITNLFENGPPDKREPYREEWEAQNTEILTWPRTPETDPYHFSSEAIGAELAASSGLPVTVAYNEFDQPDIPTAIDAAVAAGHDEVLVVTTMLTEGGKHAERELPELVAEAQARHPQVRIVYAWPFPAAAVGRFMAEQLQGAVNQAADM